MSRAARHRPRPGAAWLAAFVAAIALLLPAVAAWHALDHLEHAHAPIHAHPCDGDGHGHGGDAEGGDEACGLCADLALAATSVVPEPAGGVPPAAIPVATLATPDACAFPPSSHPGCPWARGPPRAVAA